MIPRLLSLKQPLQHYYEEPEWEKNLLGDEDVVAMVKFAVTNDGNDLHRFMLTLNFGEMDSFKMIEEIPIPIFTKSINQKIEGTNEKMEQTLVKLFDESNTSIKPYCFCIEYDLFHPCEIAENLEDDHVQIQISMDLSATKRLNSIQSFLY